MRAGGRTVKGVAGYDIPRLMVGARGTLGVIVAVSYTHLRAHETVLDLVCRLLLEKKKTQTTDPTVPHQE